MGERAFELVDLQNKELKGILKNRLPRTPEVMNQTHHELIGKTEELQTTIEASRDEYRTLKIKYDNLNTRRLQNPRASHDLKFSSCWFRGSSTQAGGEDPKPSEDREPSWKDWHTDMKIKLDCE